MKKLIQIMLIATLFLLSTSLIFAAESGIRVSIDGEPVEFTQESGSPFIDENNRTQVPFRQTLEAFGATVSWDAETRTAIAEKDDITVKIPIGTSYIYKNDMRIINDTTSVIRDGRTFLPIRIVFNAFGADVDWDGANRSIEIVSEGTGKNVGFIIIREQGYSTALTELPFRIMGFCDEEIAFLRYMTNLESLRVVMNSRVSDLSPLSELTNLRSLTLSFTQISDLTPL
ncbi:MAG: stalk domain-containing protein, partial [Clostridiales bacterium]|nr:stalk domain-containing protein [Clostridiales bacterium]